MHLLLKTNSSNHEIIIPLANNSKIETFYGNDPQYFLPRTILIDGSRTNGIVVPDDYICELHDGTTLIKKIVGLAPPIGHTHPIDSILPHNRCFDKGSE